MESRRMEIVKRVIKMDSEDGKYSSSRLNDLVLRSKFRDRKAVFEDPLSEISAAIVCDDTQWVEDLIVGLSVDPNMRDHHGNTPLYYMCCFNNDRMIDFYMQVGADPNYWLSDDSDAREMPFVYSPMFKAINGRKIKIVQVLLKHQAVIDADILAGCLLGQRKGKVRWDMLRDYVYPNVDLDSRLYDFPRYKGLTCLQIALMHLDVDGMRLLLARGADVDGRSDKLGMTALHVAFNHWYMQESVLQDNLPISRVDKDSQKLCEAVQLLLDNEANYNLLTAHGDTCLDYALMRHENALYAQCITSTKLAKCTRVLLRHAARSYHKGKLLSLQMGRIMAENEDLESFFVDCLNELDRVGAVVLESGINLYGFLEKKAEEVVRAYSLRCGQFKDPVRSMRLKQRFPIYYECLRGNLKEAIYRRNLTNRAFDGLAKIVSINWLVKNHEVTQMIFQRLDDEDMKNLGNV